MEYLNEKVEVSNTVIYIPLVHLSRFLILVLLYFYLKLFQNYLNQKSNDICYFSFKQLDISL